MDDMTQVRELFAEKQAPRAERLAPGRAALLAAVRHEDPRKTGWGAGETASRRPRFALRRSGAPRPANPRSAIRRYGWRAAIAGGLAVALTAGGIGLQVLGGSGGKAPRVVGAEPASAADLLHRAAAAAEKRPYTAPRGDQYVMQETVGVRQVVGEEDEKDFDRIEKYHAWKWQSLDGSKPSLWREREWAGGQRYFDQLDQPCRYKGHDGGPLYREIPKLPDDPEKLRPALIRMWQERGSRQSDATALWYAIMAVAGGEPQRPELRSALFMVAAKMNDVRLVRDSVDAAGRKGIAVTKVVDGFSAEIIFDRRSYAYLGDRDVTVKGEGKYPPGTVLDSEALLKSAVVDKLPAWSKKLKQQDSGC